MKHTLASLLLSFGLSAAFAADYNSYKPLDMPKAPPPVQQSLPLGAQITDRGVMVPIEKSGAFNVHVQGLSNPRPGEMGGSVGITIKTDKK